MPDPGFRTVTFKQAVLERVTKEKERSGAREMQFAPFVYGLIDEALTQRELIRDWAPLQFINTAEASVFIKDRNKNRLIELTVHEGDLWCDVDRAKDCVHVGFAWAIPQVYQIMKAHGRKPPKG